MQALKHKVPEEDEDNEQEPLTLGDQPIKLKCKFCAATMKTEVLFKNGVISYALCALAFILLPFFLAMIAIPLILLLTKNLVHHCSCCNNQVGSDGKIIYAMKYTDDVVTLKLGEMGCILTRKILLSVFLIALNVAVLAYKIHAAQSTTHSHKYGHSHAHDQIFAIESKWKEFYDDCNLNYLRQNGDPAIRHCFYKYIDKTVTNWEGYVIRVEDLRGTLKQYIHHAVTILVLMDPTEQTESQKFPDLQITFDSELADQYSSILDNIDRGNHIGFNATIKSVGFEGQTRHLHVNAIWMLEGQKEIEAHVHHSGRYKDANKNIRGKNIEPNQLSLPEISQPPKNPEENKGQEQKEQEEGREIPQNNQDKEELEKENLIEVNP